MIEKWEPPTVKEMEMKKQLKRKFSVAELKELEKASEHFTEMHDLYLENKEFRAYVDRVINASGDPLQFVLLKKTIQEVGFYYKNKPLESVNIVSTMCACDMEDKSC